jgi:hypothetical protein
MAITATAGGSKSGSSTIAELDGNKSMGNGSSIMGVTAWLGATLVLVLAMAAATARRTRMARAAADIEMPLQQSSGRAVAVFGLPNTQ